MDSILYFLFWAAFIFVMLKYGCGSHIMGHGHNKSGHNKDVGTTKTSETLRWTPPEKDVDPVCKKVVRTEKGKPSVHDGNVYYFCSRECREIFEAAPNFYVGPESEHPRAQLEEGYV